MHVCVQARTQNTTAYFTLTDLMEKTTYTIYVTAMSSHFESPKSNIISITTEGIPPHHFTIVKLWGEYWDMINTGLFALRFVYRVSAKDVSVVHKQPSIVQLIQSL